jgi:hypothetical protein
MTVACYVTPGKGKSKRICEAFAEGAGGRAIELPLDRLQPGAAAFYGVTPATKALWTLAQEAGRDRYYIDNAYFDCARERFFRVSKNAVQAAQVGPDYERLAALNITIAPWRTGGRHIVICTQSDEFMRVVADYPGTWLTDVLEKLHLVTDRPLVIRGKNDIRPLADDLVDAWALVTHASAAAVTAVLNGVPAFVTGACVVADLGNTNIADIERPFCRAGRQEWAARLAASQWTESEMRSGIAWKLLNE